MKHRDPDEPKIFFLANLMTASDLAGGFFAVPMILKGNPFSAPPGLAQRLFQENVAKSKFLAVAVTR